MRKNAACLLCIACLVLFLASCGDSKPVATQAEQEKADLNSKFLAFASSQNAIAEWETALPGGHIWRSFSIEVEHALVRSDGRPVAMRLRLNDMVRRDDRVYLEFEDRLTFYVTLEAPPDVVQQVLQHRPDGRSAEYAVIATINSVERPTFETSIDYSSDRQDAFVELTRSTLLHARGRCLNLQRLK